MLGQLSRSVPAPQTVVQTRFQGLWWGTERIWTDELVRLKIARCQFAPNGTDVIAPPAGPSARTLERMKEYGEASVDPVRLGSSERGLFLRLEGLFIVDVPTQDGSNVTKECRASGMVYELVDEDWEDPDASTENDTSGLDKGKGKARADADVEMRETDDRDSNSASRGSLFLLLLIVFRRTALSSALWCVDGRHGGRQPHARRTTAAEDAQDLDRSKCCTPTRSQRTSRLTIGDRSRYPTGWS